MYHRAVTNRRGAYSSLICGRRPFALAEIRGSEEFSSVLGVSEFFSTPVGVVVCTEVSGLPYDPYGKCAHKIYGLHIHNAGKCTGTFDDPFADAGAHFDKDNCFHPNHSGDLPPLFGNKGYAWCAVLTDRFSPEDVIGRSVIIHMESDDLSSDPSGNSGIRIACGVIKGA